MTRIRKKLWLKGKKVKRKEKKKKEKKKEKKRKKKVYIK